MSKPPRLSDRDRENADLDRRVKEVLGEAEFNRIRAESEREARENPKTTKELLREGEKLTEELNETFRRMGIKP